MSCLTPLSVLCLHSYIIRMFVLCIAFHSRKGVEGAGADIFAPRRTEPFREKKSIISTISARFLNRNTIKKGLFLYPGVSQGLITFCEQMFRLHNICYRTLKAYFDNIRETTRGTKIRRPARFGRVMQFSPNHNIISVTLVKG